MQIYCLPIVHPWSKIDSQLLKSVSPQRQEKIMRYVFEVDRKLSLYAALLARMGLSLATGIPASELIFNTTQGQKPSLLSSDYQFNLSHTRGFVLCGISDNGMIGVDVEKNVAAPIEVMEQVFHPEEIQYVIKSPVSERDTHFYKVWTRKEAYTKKLGTGLICDLKSYNTLSDSLSSSLFTWKHYNYICSVCGTPIANINIRNISESDIWDYFILPD